MFAILRSLFTALKSALVFAWCIITELVTFPLRPFMPRGHAAIPPAPRSRMPTDTTASDAARPKASPARSVQTSTTRYAANIVIWLAARKRGHSTMPDLFAMVPQALGRWAHALNREQADRAIAAGVTQLAEHLSGRISIEGLPLAGAVQQHLPAHSAPAMQVASEERQQEDAVKLQIEGPAPR